MSSTLIAAPVIASTVSTASTAALLGPLGLGLVLGVAAFAFFAGSNSSKQTNNYQSEEIRRQQELQRQRIISESWIHASFDLQTQAAEIKDVNDRESLIEFIKTLEDSYTQAMKQDDLSGANKIIEDMRRKILSVKMEEQALENRQAGIIKILDELETKAPEGFTGELEEIRRNISNSWTSLDEQSKKVSALMGKLQIIMGDVSQANSLSLEGLEEEIAFIPPLVKDSPLNNNAELNSELINDICDFGGRIAFFDEAEAERLKPLIIEAKSESSTSRLRAVRDQIKTAYGYLKERSVLTEMFRQNLRDFLPPMKKAAGTEKLCIQIEELMTAPFITRDEFNRIYKSVNDVFSTQTENIIDKLFAEKVSSKLSELGYSLIDENGKPVEIPSGRICTLSTPYEGYQMRLKVGNNTIATRLVRVAASEDEKLNISEYQKQKDIEVGKKLCGDLDKFYKSLEDDGIMIHEVMRKEPGQEALDVIVDTSAVKTRKRAAVHEQQKLNALKSKGRYN